MQSMQALGKDFVQTIVTITIVVMACSNLSEARLLMNCSGEVVEEAQPAGERLQVMVHWMGWWLLVWWCTGEVT